MRLLKHLVCAATLVLLTAGCANSGNKADSGSSSKADKSVGRKHAITDQDSGKTLTPAVGDTIVFTAPENGTTGYVWSATYDEQILEAGESSFELAEPGTQMVGSGGTRTMAFNVKAPGRTVLKLKNGRSWEQNGPGQEVDVTIEAK